MKAVKYQY